MESWFHFQGSWHTEQYVNSIHMYMHHSSYVGSFEFSEPIYTWSRGIRSVAPTSFVPSCYYHFSSMEFWFLNNPGVNFLLFQEGFCVIVTEFKMFFLYSVKSHVSQCQMKFDLAITNISISEDDLCFGRILTDDDTSQHLLPLFFLMGRQSKIHGKINVVHFVM